MYVNAIYDNGLLTFQTPIQLCHSRFQVAVIIPDHEVLSNPPNVTLSQATFQEEQRLIQAHALLGTDYQYTDPGKTDAELLAQALTEKYL